MSICDAVEFVPKIISLMDWKPGENVLDYGCGAGSTGYKLILPQVKQFNSKLYSVDISKEMLEFAKKNYSHPSITYLEGDIMGNFPLKRVKFDNIISVYVLHFFHDILLEKFNEILKPHGRLGFTAVIKSPQQDMMPVFGESETWKKYFTGYEVQFADWTSSGRFTGSSDEVFRALLQDAGFRTVHLQVLDRSFHFDSTDACTELWMSVCPLLRNIPKQIRPAFKEDVRKYLTQYAGVPYDSEQITIKYQCVVAVV